MRKLWVRWLALIGLTAVLAAVMIRLGEWQVHRLEGRRAANAIIRTNRSAAPVDWSTLFGGSITSAQQWRPVTATGTFDATKQIQVRYRSVGSTDGSEIVTVLHTTSGRDVLVDRGLLPRSASSGDDQTIPAPPSGTVTVTGYVRGDENGKPTAVVPVDGKARLINSAAIAKALDVSLPSGYIALTSVTPSQSGGLVPVPYPELDEGPHLSYAIQWFCFTVIAVAGVVILIRADLRDRHKIAQRAARRRDSAAHTADR
ncbi:SURF1 family cytochrome oxidase biogenesis protein [Acidipropionibacterium timonense]|uniref:SURF1 family cytochrome oxidase biogenesis protein n=1 Tax=Acidipropionibacterium timonense TaxID=2161818 RepID=UPI001AEC0B5A|nr:SURF1 family protein [Acidipropionibacterium timonense]